MLVVAHLGLLVVFDLKAHPILVLSALAVGFLGLFVAVPALGRVGPVSCATLLLGAIALRLLLLPLPPTLSDDLLRYVWDGRVAVSGQNPYALAPDAEELKDLRTPAWEAMPHKDVATVYPPVALALFSIASLTPKPMYGLKLILVLLEVVGCWLLIRLADRRGIPRHRVAWYAWNPLVALEVAGMGHVDAAGVLAVVAAVSCLTGAGRRMAGAALWTGLGVMIKLVPIVAVPLWARLTRNPWRFVGVLALVLMIGFLPLVWWTGGVPPGLVEYAVSWEFNGPIYEPLWRMLDRLRAPDAAAWVLDRLKDATGQHDFWNRFYPYRYPQLLAKLLLAAALLWWVARTRRDSDPIAGTGRLMGGVLLCSATLYPWYLLWILPWAALSQQRAWLALSAFIQLSYLPQMLGTEHFPWYFAMIWVPFAILLMRNPRWSTG